MRSNFAARRGSACCASARVSAPEVLREAAVAYAVPGGAHAPPGAQLAWGETAVAVAVDFVEARRQSRQGALHFGAREETVAVGVRGREARFLRRSHRRC